MGNTKKIRNHRLHREGTATLRGGLIALLAVNGLLFFLLKDIHPLPFYIVLVISVIVYLIVVNFFRCPIRIFNGNTENTVVAAADGKIVVIEEVEENEYFHDRRMMSL